MLYLHQYYCISQNILPLVQELWGSKHALPCLFAMSKLLFCPHFGTLLLLFRQPTTNSLCFGLLTTTFYLKKKEVVFVLLCIYVKHGRTVKLGIFEVLRCRIDKRTLKRHIFKTNKDKHSLFFYYPCISM